MFGIIADNDQMKDDLADHLVRKNSNLIRFGSKLVGKAFQQVCGNESTMQRLLKLVKGQAQFHIFGQQSDHLSLARASSGIDNAEFGGVHLTIRPGRSNDLIFTVHFMPFVPALVSQSAW